MAEKTQRNEWLRRDLMQLSTPTPVPDSIAKFAVEDAPDAMQSRYSEYKISRRNGAVVGFEPSKIAIALTKAFIAVNGGQGAASARVREMVTRLTEMVVVALMRRQPSGGTFHIEDIQDQVELALMRSGEHEVSTYERATSCCIASSARRNA